MISDRNLAIYEARTGGETFTDIAKRHGISAGRAAQIFRKVSPRLDHLAKSGGNDFANLSQRARGCINRALERPEHDLSVTRSDVVGIGYLRLFEIPNMGKKSMNEVVDWLGPELAARFSGHVCPNCGHVLTYD